MNRKAAQPEPEWDKNVTPPGRSSSGVRKPVARSFASACTNPMPFPPQSAIPCSRAIVATRSPSGGIPSSDGSSSNSDEKVTTLAAPASPASRTACSIRWFATPTIARSTGSGTSPIEPKQRWPSTSSYPGFTG